MPDLNIELTVSELVALLNQTLEFAYPNLTVVGELANFRVSKNQWVYFDLKDEESIVHFFGTVYQLPGPLEDGLRLKVRATPRLHPRFGFSLNVLSLELAGEGSLKRAANLLEAKLAAEGLFEPARKRLLPYPPMRLGLITSAESAAYSDFIKILDVRWGGLAISVIDVQVQGEPAASQIVNAINQFNQLAKPPEVLVITRGGGNAEDLQAFNNELVVRVVAASRIPTLVAIGHERDVSLAELAADQRASTPSHAAGLLVPDRAHILRELPNLSTRLTEITKAVIQESKNTLGAQQAELRNTLKQRLVDFSNKLKAKAEVLGALNPEAILGRGYALVRKQGKIVRQASELARGDITSLEFGDGLAQASITSIKPKN